MDRVVGLEWLSPKVVQLAGQYVWSSGVSRCGIVGSVDGSVGVECWGPKVVQWAGQ